MDKKDAKEDAIVETKDTKKDAIVEMKDATVETKTAKKDTAVETKDVKDNTEDAETWNCYLCGTTSNKWDECSNPIWCGVVNNNYPQAPQGHVPIPHSCINAQCSCYTIE